MLPVYTKSSCLLKYETDKDHNKSLLYGHVLHICTHTRTYIYIYIINIYHVYPLYIYVLQSVK